MEIEYTYNMRYQGVHVAEIDAAVHLEIRRDGEWWIDRITLRDLDGKHDVDLIGADFETEKKRLLNSRDFMGSAHELWRDTMNGYASHDREVARA